VRVDAVGRASAIASVSSGIVSHVVRDLVKKKSRPFTHST
jgi:hypothetical protein